ncbi:MAG: hypothetical protein WBF89_21785 [Steroidobacteraceae bacterium]
MWGSLRLWLRWTLLVGLSATASFVAALLSDHNQTVDIIAMLCGIATFIVINVRLETWAVSRQKTEFVKSLRVAVWIKIGLELLPAIEVLTGVMIVGLVEMLGLKSRFLETYLKTVGTGTLLAMIVFLIAAIYRYVQHRWRMRPAV